MNINWSWVAGFFQAEGSATGSYPRWKIQFYQQELEILQLLQQFILSELPSTHSSIYSDYDANRYGTSKTVARLNLNGAYAYPVIDQIYPRLRGYKRQQIDIWLTKNGHIAPNTIKELDIDFVIGFWEGDGSPTLDSTSKCIQLDFAQKDIVILQEIQNLLQVGAIMHSVSSNALRIYGTKERLDIWLQHIRSPRRYKQLVDTIERLSLLKESSSQRPSS